MTTDADPISLSKRGQFTFSDHNNLTLYLEKSEASPYNPDTNPEGVINLGSSVNKLMESEMKDRLSSDDIFNFTPSLHQYYYDLHGKHSLRTALANFFNTYFNVAEEVSPEHLIVMSGSASCLDSLSFALFDPDDIYITPTPTYGRIFTNFNQRSLAQPCPLELPEKPDSKGRIFSLTSELLENKILQLQKQGKVPKGFVLINPQNPLGHVYTPQLVQSLLEVCAKYEMHVVIDVVYALSLLSTGVEVSSSLSIPSLPDPERTHTVWSFSKDMCLPGFRIGVIHTRNSALLNVLKKVAIFCPAASIIQDAATSILSDQKWLDEVYIPQQRQKLHDRYQLIKCRLEALGIDVQEPEAGLFVWINLRKFLNSSTKEAELELFDELIKSGVYIIPGAWMHCNYPGWFRISLSEKTEEFEEGLKRFETVLKGRMLQFQP